MSSERNNNESSNSEQKYVPLKGYENDYEIEVQYPHTIRRISNGFVPKESIDKDGYVRVCLNRVPQYKHVLIANQFIPNDDPVHKTQVDHIIQDRDDYHISNLRWVTPKENNENKSSYKGIAYEYVDDIPDESIEITDYGNHELEFYYFCDNEFYFWNGVRYRKLDIKEDKRNGSLYVNMRDINNKQVRVYINKFKRLYDLE